MSGGALDSAASSGASNIFTIDNELFYKCQHGAIARLPKRYPQVGVLTNYEFYKHQPTDFVYLEKTDGERTLLLIDENMLYKLSIQPQTCLTLLDNTLPTTSFSLIDCEYYDGEYYVFDAYAVDNVFVYDYSFTKRINAVKDFLNKTPLRNIHCKTIHEVNKDNMNDIIKNVNTLDVSQETGHRIDGVVFQLIDESYESPNTICFKLKKRSLNTIDFLLKYDINKNIYRLYLQNRLFKCPYWYGLDKLFINKQKQLNDYTIDQQREIIDLLTKMSINPNEFNNKIVELSLTKNNHWVPMRVRSDKLYSNSYRVGITNCGVMFSPLTMDDSYFTKSFDQSPFSTSIRSQYHDTAKVIRKHIFNRLFKLVGKQKDLSVLDLCGGRGADAKYLLANRDVVKDIFVVDADKQALVQYVERYYNKCSINARHVVLDEDVNKTNKLIKTIQYHKQQYDIIVMNYAIHYLCDNITKLINLRTLIETLLKPHGIVIITYFNGDKLLKNLPIKGFEGIQPSDNQTSCLMALPTIDPTGYRNEPLVKQHHIDIMTDNELSIVEQFYPLEQLIQSHKELINDVSDYLTCVQTIVLST